MFFYYFIMDGQVLQAGFLEIISLQNEPAIHVFCLKSTCFAKLLIFSLKLYKVKLRAAEKILLREKEEETYARNKSDRVSGRNR